MAFYFCEMISFPNAKINIGLNVVSKRPDGYHNLETVFYPVQLCDALEMVPADKTEISVSGIHIESPPSENLVVKAWNLLAAEFQIPPVKIHLHKKIPAGAGLGGGSSDAAFALKMLNDFFELNLSQIQLEYYAAKLGADCPFFIRNNPVFAAGTGNLFEPVKLDLSSYKIVIVKPDFSVPTAEAFKKVIPAQPKFNLKEIVKEPVETWKEKVFNDFEKTVFLRFPELARLKELLYRAGAVYASLSGSGSALYGIFRHLPADFDNFLPKGIFIYR